MNWNKFNRYYDNMTRIEQALVTKRFNEYMVGNDAFKDANKPEIESRLELFKCGWVTACIERD